MDEFRLRTDLERVRLGDFAFPLGIEPHRPDPPMQGYMLSYNVGEDEDPDTYTFSIVVSHEKLRPIVDWAFEALLPEVVTPILEVDSEDAYRLYDVYLSAEDDPIPCEAFVDTWHEFGDILMEEGQIGIGANAEEPFVEVFLDQWKTLVIHVPLDLRDAVAERLVQFGLDEVPETWGDSDDIIFDGGRVRPVLDQTDNGPGLEELLLDLRHQWNLELNVDPDRNLDQGGRDLGLTLWHVVAIADDAQGDENRGAYLTFWLTAASMAQAETMIVQEMGRLRDWHLSEVYSMNRIAFDDRPEELRELPPRPAQAQTHLVQIESWTMRENGSG